MELIQEGKGNFFSTSFSNNDQFIVGSMSSFVDIMDAKTFLILKRLYIKNAGQLQFSPNDNYLIIKSTTSILYICDMKKMEIIFHKKIGECDGYNIVFMNDNEFMTGEFLTQSIVFNIKELNYKILPIKYFIEYLAQYEDNKLIGFASSNNTSYIFKLLNIYINEFEILYKNEKIGKTPKYSKNCMYFASAERYNKFSFNKLNILDRTVKSVKIYFSPYWISAQKLNHYVGLFNLSEGCIFDSNLNVVKKIEKTISNTAVNISFANCSDMVLINVDRKLMLYSLQ